MRDLLKKMTTASMVVGAALLVSACGGSETANTADTNLTEMNSMEPAMDGSMNDMTAVDGAMGSDMNSGMDNSAMGAMENSAMNGMNSMDSMSMNSTDAGTTNAM